MNITIIAEHTPRASYFESLIREEYDNSVSVQVIPYKELLDLKTDENTLIVIDLMDFERSAFKILENLKKTHSLAKVLALHIYQSEELITPLFKKGISGYVSSDPTRQEFIKAVTKVINGEIYRSDFSS
jgi:DNA-binding NarL/FixJ family response regulator